VTASMLFEPLEDFGRIRFHAPWREPSIVDVKMT